MFTLTLIKGPNVTGWVRDMGEIWRQLNDAGDDIPAVWDQFLIEFRQQFQDTQKAKRVRIKLENLKMKDREIDSYISQFEEIARDAGYTVRNPETIYLFYRGLPRNILIDVLKLPHIHIYKEMKELAVESSKFHQLLDNILGPQPQFTKFQQ